MNEWIPKKKLFFLSLNQVEQAVGRDVCRSRAFEEKEKKRIRKELKRNSYRKKIIKE
jgi:hypothetical protein